MWTEAVHVNRSTMLVGLKKTLGREKRTVMMKERNKWFLKLQGKKENFVRVNVLFQKTGDFLLSRGALIALNVGYLTLK